MTCLCGGCNVIGAVASRMGPPPKIPAQFTPANEPTVIIVENAYNPASLRLESETVARHLAGEFELNKVAPIIDAGQVDALRASKGAEFRKMPIDSIARALGAKQVIYVNLERFDVDKALASEMYGGAAEAQVRVVDSTGAVLWPNDSARGYPIGVRIDPQRPSPIGGVGDGRGGDEPAVRQKLHMMLADKVAKLFYEWNGESSDGAQERL